MICSDVVNGACCQTQTTHTHTHTHTCTCARTTVPRIGAQTNNVTVCPSWLDNVYYPSLLFAPAPPFPASSSGAALIAYPLSFVPVSAEVRGALCMCVRVCVCARVRVGGGCRMGTVLNDIAVRAVAAVRLFFLAHMGGLCATAVTVCWASSATTRTTPNSAGAS